MWTAEFIYPKDVYMTLQVFVVAPQVSISFCTNGLLFLAEGLTYFICREDMLEYEIPITSKGPQSGTFSILTGHGQRNLIFGQGGVRIEVDDSGQSPQIRTVPIGETAGRHVICEADILTSAGAQQIRPPSDLVLRVIAYNAKMDSMWKRKIEIPIPVNSKLPGSGANLSIDMVASKHTSKSPGQLTLTIAGANISSKVWAGPDFTLSGSIQAARLRETCKLISVGMAILGVIPPLGDFGPIWYIRSTHIGRLVAII